jgi:hypothetical protein
MLADQQCKLQLVQQCSSQQHHTMVCFLLHCMIGTLKVVLLLCLCLCCCGLQAR